MCPGTFRVAASELGWVLRSAPFIRENWEMCCRGALTAAAPPNLEAETRRPQKISGFHFEPDGSLCSEMGTRAEKLWSLPATGCNNRHGHRNHPYHRLGV